MVLNTIFQKKIGFTIIGPPHGKLRDSKPAHYLLVEPTGTSQVGRFLRLNTFT